MVDTVSGFEQIFLTYKDVKEANPGWTDEMVEDYLALKRDVTTTTVTADIATDTNSATNDGAIALDEVERLRVQSVIITSNYTTFLTNEVVICNNVASIDVTLNTTPEINDQVNIKRNLAEVNVLGDIDGFTDKLINIQYFSLKLIYNGTNWSQI